MKLGITAKKSNLCLREIIMEYRNEIPQHLVRERGNMRVDQVEGNT